VRILRCTVITIAGSAGVRPDFVVSSADAGRPRHLAKAVLPDLESLSPACPVLIVGYERSRTVPVADAA
jgi:hypothetical protein